MELKQTVLPGSDVEPNRVTWAPKESDRGRKDLCDGPMDHLLHVLDHIEELLRELMLAEVRGEMKGLKGFDVIHSLVHSYCKLVNMLQEGVGLPTLPKTIREKGVHLELEKEVVEREGGNSEHTRESSRPP